LQVNAAVDELAGFAEACAKAMSSVARNQLARVGAEERIRLQELYHSIAVRVKYWQVLLMSTLLLGVFKRMVGSGHG
jgi:hypothetical protein